MPSCAGTAALSPSRGLDWRCNTQRKGVPVTQIPATQHAIQIVGVDEIVHNTEKPVDEVGPFQLLLQVEACGICFSDTKLLHAFDSHPRKAEVISGIDLDALPDPLPVGSRVLAALGPKMRELAGNRSAGVHPYLGTPALTRISREELGPGPLVAPEQAAVLSTDVDHARRVARDHLSRYLVLPNYARSIVRVGFDEADLADGGSDRLVDTLVVHGDEAAIAGRVDEHREAGADHVCVQVLNDDPVALPREEWRRLAPALVAG